MSNLPSLLRQTLRALSRAPGYAAAASLTLALGLAAALGALSPAWDLLAVPFDFKEPGRIVSLSEEGAEGAEFLRPLARNDFDVLARELRGLSHLGACRDDDVELAGVEGPVSHRTALVNPDFFPALGLPLALGRPFTPEEMLPGGPRVLVLTHGFWQRHFGGDPSILGRTLRAADGDHQIVGVLAPQKRLPWFLQEVIALRPLRTQDPCWVYGRLGKGQGLASLQAELDRLIPRLGPSRAAGDRSWGIKARGLTAFWRGQVAPALALPIASGLLILLLACANVAHLMLARSLGRAREWGLRTALGAGQGGLKGPLLMEASLLIAAGALLSLPLLKGLKLSGVLSAEGLQGPVLVPMAAALVVSLLVTSLLPLRWARRLDLNETLREGGTASASRGSNRLRGVLAVVQLAFAFALLVGAGLSLRALERLRSLNPGYDLKHLQVAILRLDMRPGENFMARSAAFQRHVRQAMVQVPGVDAVAMSSTRPLVDQGHVGTIWPEGQGILHVGQHAVSPEYFQTLRIPLLAGRNLEEGERDSCLVSASLALRCWGEASPLGRQIRMDSAEARPLNVVGVVGEARMSRLAREAAPAIYTSLARAGSAYLTVYLRSAASTAALRQSVQEAARQSDSGAQLLEFQSLPSLATREQEGPRTLRRQTLGAGLLAAFLAGIGLTGTLAQAAARQKREWGIRTALGASPLSLFQLVFRRVLNLLMAGLALGTLLAWILGRILQHQLQGLSPADPGILVFAMVSLGFTCFLAGLGPALRAARLNPADALRSE